MLHHWAVLRKPGRFTGDLAPLEMCTHVCGCNTQQLVQGHTVTFAGTWMVNCRLMQVHGDDMQGCPPVPTQGHPPAHAAPSPCLQEHSRPR